MTSTTAPPTPGPAAAAPSSPLRGGPGRPSAFHPSQRRRLPPGVVDLGQARLARSVRRAAPVVEVRLVPGGRGLHVAGVPRAWLLATAQRVRERLGAAGVAWPVDVGVEVSVSSGEAGRIDLELLVDAVRAELDGPVAPVLTLRPRES